MRLIARVEETAEEWLRLDFLAIEKAVTGAMVGAGNDVRDHLRQVTRAAFERGQGVAQAWRTKVYPKDDSGTGARNSVNASALIYTRAPLIIDAANRGATIRPGGGRRYLAIPTGYNLIGGRRRRATEAGAARRGARRYWEGVRVTPQQMVASRLAFTRPIPGGKGLAWFLRVTEAQSRGRSGRIIRQAIAGAVVRVGTGRGRNRMARASNLLEAGAVPMFWLVPESRMRRVLDLNQARDLGAASLALRLGAELERRHG